MKEIFTMHYDRCNVHVSLYFSRSCVAPVFERDKSGALGYLGNKLT